MSCSSLFAICSERHHPGGQTGAEALYAELLRGVRALRGPHTVLAGVESWRLFMVQDIRYSTLASQPFAIDIHNPTYGQPSGNLTPGLTPATASAPRACSCKTRWT